MRSKTGFISRDFISYPFGSSDKLIVLRKSSGSVYGLYSLESALLTENQIEAARKAIRRLTKKSGRLYTRVYPYQVSTKKPAEVRMGKGKGKIHQKVCPLFSGQCIFELSDLPANLAIKALSSAANKFSFSSKIINLSL